MRIPGWSQGTTISINGKNVDDAIVSGSYQKIAQKWKKGDVIELNIPMPVELMQANPLVEEIKNQVAVKRGPIVYCLESNELPANTSVNDVLLNVNSKFTTDFIKIDNRNLLSINASSSVTPNISWDKKLYQPLPKEEGKT